jgi:hypothetical protein
MTETKKELYGFYSKREEICRDRYYIYKHLNDENKMVIVTRTKSFKSEEEALLYFNNEFDFQDKEYRGRIGELVDCERNPIQVWDFEEFGKFTTSQEISSSNKEEIGILSRGEVYGFYSYEQEKLKGKYFIYKTPDDKDDVTVTSVTNFRSEKEALLYFDNKFKFENKEYRGKLGEFVGIVNTFKTIDFGSSSLQQDDHSEFIDCVNKLIRDMEECKETMNKKLYGFYSLEQQQIFNTYYIYKSLDKKSDIEVTFVARFKSEEEAFLYFNNMYLFEDKQFIGEIGEFMLEVKYPPIKTSIFEAETKNLYGFSSPAKRFKSKEYYVYKTLDGKDELHVTHPKSFRNDEEALSYFNNEYKYADKQYYGQLGDFVAFVDMKTKTGELEFVD